MGSSVKDAHLHIGMEDSKTEKPGIWSASFAFGVVRRSTVVDEVCRCHARPAERSGLLARCPREIISTCWSHPSTASAPTSHDVHEGGSWTSERLWSIRCTGRLWFALRLAKRPGEVHSKPACHADRPGRAGVANADRESKLVGMPVPWTCDLDRTSRSCRVFCSLQCMACVHWSTQATAAALVHRQMAMRPLWRRSNAEEGHRHWAALCSGELTHTYSGKKDAAPPPLLVTTP